ncbi:hypothetical protein B0H19DRAFT_1256443 [Mycena capillaripes]|nr:hypothetical protein B0H19DRAFT_1256443 [Mycena capillaripes]
MCNPLVSDDLEIDSQLSTASAPYLSPDRLSTLSVLLHTLLGVLHIFLVVVWAQDAEKQAIFSTTMQTTASTTSFGTLSYAILVYLTQKLAICRTLQRKQTLTTSHDTISALSGIGAAAQQVLVMFRLRPQAVKPRLFGFGTRPKPSQNVGLEQLLARPDIPSGQS